MTVRFEGSEVFVTVQREESITMSLHLREFIQRTIEEHSTMKIPAIKFVRAEYGLGLKEAKDIVDAIADLDRPVTNLGQLLREKLDRG